MLHLNMRLARHQLHQSNYHLNKMPHWQNDAEPEQCDKKMNTKSITALVHVLNLFLQSATSNWRETKTCFSQFFNYRLASFTNKHCNTLHNNTNSSKSWKHSRWLILFHTLLMQNLWRVIWNVFFLTKENKFWNFLRSRKIIQPLMWRF